MGRKIQTLCKKRTKKRCLQARKSCKYASGKTRKYCRRSRNVRKNKRTTKSVHELYKRAYPNLTS